MLYSNMHGEVNVIIIVIRCIPLFYYTLLNRLHRAWFSVCELKHTMILAAHVQTLLAPELFD